VYGHRPRRHDRHLTATPAPGYALGVPEPQGGPVDDSGWAGCSPVPGVPVRCTAELPAGDTIVEASFRPAALLLVVANGGGGSVTATIPAAQTGETGQQTCNSDQGGGVLCPYPYLLGRAVTLTPSPMAAPFPIWSDDDCPDGMACTLVLDELRQSITATFPTQHVSVRLHGPGRVVSTPAGIDCTALADGVPVECGADFATGQDTALTAEGVDAAWVTDPAPTRAGCDFTAGTVCHVIAERSRWAVVSFAGAVPDEQYPPTAGARFRVRKSGSGSGVVRGGGIDCGSVCSVERDFGDRIVLLAEPSRGSEFVGWRRGCGQAARCGLTVGPTTRITAVFAATASAAVVTPTPTPTPTVKKLRATLDRVKVRRIRSRYRIVLSLHLNLSATVRARVTTRGGLGVARRSWQSPAGDRRMTMRVRARRGRYRLSLTMRSTDGQVQVLKRTLRLR
jgi:Divergent InlB B-repeat domain